MKKNVGNPDRQLRFLVAAVIAILYFAQVITGTLAIILLIIGGVMLLTSLIGNCPIYSVLRINTSIRSSGNKVRK